MVIFLLFGLILTGVAVALAMRTLAFDHLRHREALAQIDAYGFGRPVPDAASGPVCGTWPTASRPPSEPSPSAGWATNGSAASLSFSGAPGTTGRSRRRFSATGWSRRRYCRFSGCSC